MLTTMQKFFSDIQAAMDSKKPYEDVGFSIHDVQHRFEEYKASVNKILTSPPQPAAKETTGSGEKKKEDVDMKNEEPADKK